MMRLKYYSTDRGREPVKEFITELPESTRREIFILLRRLEDGENLSMPHSRNLSQIVKGLYELRLRDKQGQVRVFYYLAHARAIYLLHALRKKNRIISNDERRLIIKRIREVQRHRLG